MHENIVNRFISMSKQNFMLRYHAFSLFLAGDADSGPTPIPHRHSNGVSRNMERGD
jgi:hypothetical protein